MWTEIIFMCILQLQIFWINPCIALSSTNESLFASNEDLDLRAGGISYDDILGKPIRVYTDDPKRCYKFYVFGSKYFYFQAITYCVIKNQRLLDYRNTQDMKWLEKFLRSKVTAIRRVWIFNNIPQAGKDCYYAFIDEVYGFRRVPTDCLNQAVEIPVITVAYTKPGTGTKCPAVDEAKFIF
ncbi:unnamed protein product [Orchesella dallaii]|uniref:Uncharacterized protein n=1 Tax=Orchesella dallaii TaxID=48710 RepID=A0ABP1QD76_9HEXA